MRKPDKKTVAFAEITRDLVLEPRGILVADIKARYDIADRTWREWRLTFERWVDLEVVEEDGVFRLVRAEPEVASRLWVSVHNLVAHPLMSLFPRAAWPVMFHDFSAERAWSGR